MGSALGWVLHRDPDTYRYIPESVRRYPGAQGVADLLRQRGFDEVRVVPLFGGFMTLHVAREGQRPDIEPSATQPRPELLDQPLDAHRLR